jgi:hypothetical protein
MNNGQMRQQAQNPLFAAGVSNRLLMPTGILAWVSGKICGQFRKWQGCPSPVGQRLKLSRQTPL